MRRGGGQQENTAATRRLPITVTSQRSIQPAGAGLYCTCYLDVWWPAGSRECNTLIRRGRHRPTGQKGGARWQGEVRSREERSDSGRAHQERSGSDQCGSASRQIPRCKSRCTPAPARRAAGTPRGAWPCRRRSPSSSMVWLGRAVRWLSGEIKYTGQALRSIARRRGCT